MKVYSSYTQLLHIQNHKSVQRGMVTKAKKVASLHY